VVLVLSRQNLPTLDRSRYAPADGLRRGAYILLDAPDAKPELILIASGSDVGLIAAAGERLQEQGIAVRWVSMPSWELFDALTQAERDQVLPPSVSARLAVEAGAAQGWHRYVGAAGDVLTVERFGASAPADVLLREYGFTVEGGLQASAGAEALKGLPVLVACVRSGSVGGASRPLCTPPETRHRLRRKQITEGRNSANFGRSRQPNSGPSPQAKRSFRKDRRPMEATGYRASSRPCLTCGANRGKGNGYCGN
jgi:hypothetical protein